MCTRVCSCRYGPYHFVVAVVHDCVVVGKRRGKVTISALAFALRASHRDVEQDGNRVISASNDKTVKIWDVGGVDAQRVSAPVKRAQLNQRCVQLPQTVPPRRLPQFAAAGDVRVYWSVFPVGVVLACVRVATSRPRCKYTRWAPSGTSASSRRCRR